MLVQSLIEERKEDKPSEEVKQELVPRLNQEEIKENLVDPPRINQEENKNEPQIPLAQDEPQAPIAPQQLQEPNAIRRGPRQRAQRRDQQPAAGEVGDAINHNPLVRRHVQLLVQQEQEAHQRFHIFKKNQYDMQKLYMDNFSEKFLRITVDHAKSNMKYQLYYPSFLPIDQDAQMQLRRCKKPQLSAEYTSPKGDDKSYRSRFRVLGKPGKGLGVKFQEAYKAQNGSYGLMFAKKAEFLLKADERKGVDVSLDMIHRVSRAFEIQTSAQAQFSPRNLALQKKDLKLGFKLSHLPLFSTLTMDLLELKSKNLTTLLLNPSRYTPSYDSLLHLTLRRDLLFGLHSTLKRPHLHSFQAGLLYKTDSSESIVVLNGEVNTMGNNLYEGFRFRSASVKHQQRVCINGRQLRYGFDFITYQFGQRFAVNTLQGRMVMLYNLYPTSPVQNKRYKKKQQENTTSEEEESENNIAKPDWENDSVIGLKMNSLRGFQLSLCRSLTQQVSLKLMGRVRVHDANPRVLSDFGMQFKFKL